MSVSVSVSRCGFHAARGESEWCIYCDVLLLKQLLSDICQAAGDFCFQRHTCARALSCCDGIVIQWYVAPYTDNTEWYVALMLAAGVWGGVGGA